MMVLDENMKGIIHFRTKCHGQLSKSVKTFDSKPQMSTCLCCKRKSQWITKSIGFILLGPKMSGLNVIAIHPTVSETFQSGGRCRPVSHSTSVVKSLLHRSLCKVQRKRHLFCVKTVKGDSVGAKA